jgi:hypothetical protein
MAYPRDEQETVLVYETVTGKWRAYSTVPKHIRKIAKVADIDLGGDTPNSIDTVLTEKQIGIKRERVMSEAQRDALRKAQKSRN